MNQVKWSLFFVCVCLLTAGTSLAQTGQDVDWSVVKKTWDSLTVEERATYQQMLDEMKSNEARPSGSTATILGKRVTPTQRVATDTCGMGYELGALPFGDSNGTTGFVDDYQLTADCGGATFEPYTGEDLAYLVQVDQTCDVQVSITNESHDAAVYVLTDCAAQTCVAGGDDPEDAPFTATAGTDYWVIADGWNGQDGTYDLSITETSATGCTLVPVELQSFSVN